MNEWMNGYVWNGWKRIFKMIKLSQDSKFLVNSLYLSIPIYLFIFLSLSIYLSFYPYQSIYLSIPIYLSIYLSFYPYLSIYLSIYLCIYLSIYLSIYLCRILRPSNVNREKLLDYAKKAALYATEKKSTKLPHTDWKMLPRGA